MADNFEVAKAYVTIVPSMEGSQATITKELTGITSEASSKAGEEGGSTFGNKFATALKGTAAVIGGAMAAATGTAIATGKAFVDSANSVAAYGDEVDKMSQKLGLSTDAYQSYDYVLKVAGTDMASMTTGLKTLTNKLDDAKSGSEDAQAMFAALGLSMEDISNMSREDLFESVIRGFQQMPDSAERAALANDLFAKSGQNLAPLFNMTTEEMDALLAKTEELGMVMSEEEVKNAAAYKDAMTTLQGTFTGLKNSLMSSFMPGLTQVMEGLANVFAGNGGVEDIKEGLNSVIGNIVMLAPEFFTLAETIVTSLLEGFAPMLPSLVNSIFIFLNNGIKTVVGLIPQLTPILIQGIKGILSALQTAAPLLLKGLIQMVSELVTWLASDDNVKTFLDGLLELVSELAMQLSTLLPVLVPAIVNIIGQIADFLTDPNNVNMLLSAVLTIVGAIIVALINAVPELIKAEIKILQNIATQLVSWGTTIIDNVGPWLAKIINKFVNWSVQFVAKVKTWKDEVVEKIKSLASSVVEKLKGLPDDVKKIGKNLITGLWNGIKDKVQWLKDRIGELGSTVTSTIKKKLGIKSPSRVWKEEVGKNLALGIGEGFEETMADVRGDMTDSMDGLTGSMSTEVNAYGSDASQLGSSNVYNGGNISINVYGAEGQNVDDLAKQIAYRLEEMTRRKEAVYG